MNNQPSDETKEENEFTVLGRKVIHNYNAHDMDKHETLIPCVLVATGTFSPVHRMHIINMELAKQHMEQTNSKYRVIGGFISPTHDAYCSYKLGDTSIAAVHRIQMLSLALEDNEWIEVSPWHANQKHMVSINSEVGYIEKMIANLYPQQFDRFVVFYVCGSDLANKCGFNSGFGRFGVCIIQRESELMLPYDIENNVNPPVFLIDIPKEYDQVKNASSTEIRYCINNQQLVNHVTYDCVQRYMVQHDIMGAHKLKDALLKYEQKQSLVELDVEDTDHTDEINLSQLEIDETKKSEQSASNGVCHEQDGK